MNLHFNFVVNPCKFIIILAEQQEKAYPSIGAFPMEEPSKATWLTDPALFSL